MILCISKPKNAGFIILVLMQLISIGFAPLVANKILFDSTLTLFNTIFIFINSFFIIYPWHKCKNQDVIIKDKVFFRFYKKALYTISWISIFANLFDIYVVFTHIPDIASFKAKMEFTELYNIVPGFSILFRMSSVLRYFGYLAIPISIYYLGINNIKEAKKAALLSTSTLLGAIAFYSRAQILNYALLWIVLFYFYSPTLPNPVFNKVSSLVKKASLVLGGIFLVITILRFSSDTMWYYGDRIPKESVVKDVILYNITDYTSKGFPNGINQLEKHSIDDILYGKQIYHDGVMLLSYFGIISTTTDDLSNDYKLSYRKSGLNEGNDEGTFHGHTCRMVKNFGYLLTFILDLWFFLYVRTVSSRSKISIWKMTVLCFLMVESLGQIFYMQYGIVLYPLIFYITLRFIYKFKTI